MKYVIFHNAADDSYMNTTDNFRGAFAATQTIDIYFESPISSTTETGGSYDKITCAVTDGEEDRAIEQLTSAMTSPRDTIIVADDVNSVYACQDITSVTTIAKAVSGASSNVITLTDDRTLTSGESGSFVVLNHATKVITLPTAAAGLNYKIMFLQDTDAACSIVAGSGDAFFGNIKVTSATEDQTEIQDINHATAIATVANYDNLDFDHDEAALGGKAGDIVHLMAVDSTAWHVETVLTTDHANPASIAVINAG